MEIYWAQVVHNFIKEACYEDGDSKVTKPYSLKIVSESEALIAIKPCANLRID